MTHGHAHEEAEHASHHAEDPFAKSVALSMVVIAALLAGVKVLAHRTHNDTLAYQIKAGVEQGAANEAKTEASNLFNFFQFKRMREEMVLLKANQDLRFAVKGAPPDKVPVSLPGHEERLAGLVKELSDEKVEKAPEVALGILKRMEKRYMALVKEGYAESAALPVIDAETKAARYRAEGAVILAKAAVEKEKGEEAAKKGKKYGERSNALHEQTNWFDAGELGVELAIVLCSVAILAKDRRFWYGGMAIAAVGVVIVTVGLFK